MDQGTLVTLQRMVRPVELSGAITLERASSMLTLNFEVARFHAAVLQAQRTLELGGTVDERLERELVGRALELARERALLLGPAVFREGSSGAPTASA